MGVGSEVWVAVDVGVGVCVEAGRSVGKVGARIRSEVWSSEQAAAIANSEKRRFARKPFACIGREPRPI